MRLLLIDNSNTRTKFALSAPGQQSYDIQRVPTQELGAPLIEKLQALEFDDRSKDFVQNRNLRLEFTVDVCIIKKSCLL